MIKIGILGDIGSGKSYVANSFGYPVFNADEEVGKLYKKDKKVLKKFKRVLPRYFNSLPINKKYVSQAILDNKNNLKKIIKIVHVQIRKKMNFFLKKNKSKKFVILDIPLLLENNINNKNDILVYVQTKKSDVLKKLKMRKNFNKELMKQFSKIQLPLDYKKKKSHFVIKNDFKRRTVLKYIKNILREID